MTAAVRYPSYKDMDPHLDVARLTGLDLYIRERLERRLAVQRDLAFYTGPFIIRPDAPTLPGTKMVYLSICQGPDDYYALDNVDLWRPSAEADEFSELMDFIATLPFEATGRMIIIYDEGGCAVTEHRDHDSVDLCHEFIWLRTNRDKRLYMLDPATGEKLYVDGYSAWFDTVNQYHGADASDGLSWSIRVDGRFSDAFRSTMPDVPENRASRPSAWAAANQKARL